MSSYNVGHIDIDFIKQETSKIVENLDFLNVEYSQEYLIEGLSNYISTGKLPKQSEKDYIAEKKAQKSLEQMGKTERPKGKEKELYVTKRKRIQQETRIKNLISKGKKLLEMGKTKSEICDKLHLERQPKRIKNEVLKILDLK